MSANDAYPARQINDHDVRLALTALDKVIKAVNSFVLYDAEFTLYDDTGSYIVGTIYFDSDLEHWRWDTRNYGERDRKYPTVSADSGVVR